MSSNDEIQDALTRHQIFVLRYAKGKEKRAAEVIASAIRNGIERLENLDLQNRAAAQAVIRDLYEYLISISDEYTEEFVTEMREFVKYEAGVNTRIMGKAINIDLQAPAPVQVQQAIFGNVMSIEPQKGYTVGEALLRYGRNNADKVTTLAREGILLGKSNDEIAQDILDIIPTQERKAATLARTITNHVATSARNETMKEHQDVVDGYKWVATLDSRTSLICGSRDGIVYELDDSNPKPPAHFNCRSTISFVVNPEYDLGKDITGTRPAKGDTKGRVSADLNYGDWLRRQSPDFQERVLGAERAKLFRDGGMTLDRFVDDQGNVLTLDELRADDDNFI